MSYNKGVTMTSISPYKCASIVNEWLKADNIDKKLPPQMFYTYTSPEKNYIKATTNAAGKREVKLEDLQKWYDKYSQKFKVTEEVEIVEDDGADEIKDYNNERG
jgi:hypothetical protein